MPFTEVKGINTYYEEYGDPKNSKLVLFIHGLGEIFQKLYQDIFIQ